MPLSMKKIGIRRPNYPIASSLLEMTWRSGPSDEQAHHHPGREGAQQDVEAELDWPGRPGR